MTLNNRWRQIVNNTIQQAITEDIVDSRNKPHDDMPTMPDDDIEKPFVHNNSPSDRIAQYREDLHKMAVNRRSK